MNFPGAAVLLLALLMALTLGAVTHVGAQGLAWRFSAQSAGAISPPDWLPEDSLRAALSYYDDSRRLAGFEADLDLDGTQDYVFRASLEVCGSNCEYLLVDGRTRSTLGRVGGSVLFVGPVRVNGYPVVRTYGHSSADSGGWSTSIFDGQGYVSVGSVHLEGESLNRLFEELRDVPFWPASR